MTKEDLIAQGLTEEQAKYVMAEHGKSVTTLKAQIDTLKQSETELKNQVTKHTADLKKLQKDNGDNEELKSQIKQLQKENADQETKYQESLVAIQRDSALNALLSETKAKNPKAVAALLDNDTISFKDGQLIGAREQLEALQKSDAYLFDLGKKPGGYNPPAGSSAETYESFEDAMKAGDVDGFFKQQMESEED